MIKIMKRSAKGRRLGDVLETTDFLWSSRGICLVGEDVSAEQLLDTANGLDSTHMSSRRLTTNSILKK